MKIYIEFWYFSTFNHSNVFLGTLENFEQKNGKIVGGKPQYGKSFCEGVIVGHIIEFQADWISHSVEGVQVQWKNVYFIPTVQDVFFFRGSLLPGVRVFSCPIFGFIFEIWSSVLYSCLVAVWFRWFKSPAAAVFCQLSEQDF